MPELLALRQELERIVTVNNPSFKEMSDKEKKARLIFLERCWDKGVMQCWYLNAAIVLLSRKKNGKEGKLPIEIYRSILDYLAPRTILLVDMPTVTEWKIKVNANILKFFENPDRILSKNTDSLPSDMADNEKPTSPPSPRNSWNIQEKITFLTPSKKSKMIYSYLYAKPGLIDNDKSSLSVTNKKIENDADSKQSNQCTIL